MPIARAQDSNVSSTEDAHTTVYPKRWFNLTLKPRRDIAIYEMEVAQDIEFRKIAFHTQTPQPIFRALLDPGVYFCRVRLKENSGKVREWTKPYSVSIAPPAPLTASPPADFPIMDSPLVLQWQKIPQATEYVVRLRHETGTTIEKVVSEPLVEFKTLQQGTYHWSVQAKLNLGASELADGNRAIAATDKSLQSVSSTIKKIQIDPEFSSDIDRPIMVWPLGNLGIDNKPVTFSWSEVDGAAAYDVQLFRVNKSKDTRKLIASRKNVPGLFTRDLVGVLAPGDYSWKLTPRIKKTKSAPTGVAAREVYSADFSIREPGREAKGNLHMGAGWGMSQLAYGGSNTENTAAFSTAIYGPRAFARYSFSQTLHAILSISQKYLVFKGFQSNLTELNLGGLLSLGQRNFTPWSFETGAYLRLKATPEFLAVTETEYSNGSALSAGLATSGQVNYALTNRTSINASLELSRDLMMLDSKSIESGALFNYRLAAGMKAYWFFPWTLAAEIGRSQEELAYKSSSGPKEITNTSIDIGMWFIYSY